MRAGLRLLVSVLGVVLVISGSALAAPGVRFRQADSIKLSLAPGDTYIPVTGDQVTNSQDGTQYMQFTMAEGDRVESGAGVVRSVLLTNEGQDVEVFSNTKLLLHGGIIKLSQGAVDVENDTNGPLMAPYSFDSFESPAHPPYTNVKVALQADDSANLEVIGGHAKVSFAPGEAHPGPNVNLRTGLVSGIGGVARGATHHRHGHWHRVVRSRHRHGGHHHRLHAVRAGSGPDVSIQQLPHGASTAAHSHGAGTQPTVSISVQPAEQIRVTSPPR